MESSASSSEYIETTEVPADIDHPFMTTSFSDYTVTEGLLLLILLALIMTVLERFFGRWF